MLAKLERWYSPDSFEKEEDRQAARILIVIIIGSIATCVFTVLGGFYWHERSITLIGCLGILLQIVPLVLFAFKRLNACSFFIGLTTLMVVTLGATLGQGIHDISIMAYPVIILVASLIMQRFSSVLLTALSAVSIIWLIYGEARGLFIPRPTLHPSLADFFIMVAILTVAAVVVNMQARDMRKNLHKAQQEIIQRKDMEEQLRFLGTHDILTGVYNRLFFDGELSRLEKSRDFPISMIVADLDDLKKTNDTLGHAIGDGLLKRASSVLSSALRQGDILARIGGDEFAVLLPNTGEDSVQAILSRICTRIDEINAAQPDLNLGLSLGTATSEKGNLNRAFLVADKRMYAEKSARKKRAGSALVPEHT